MRTSVHPVATDLLRWLLLNVFLLLQNFTNNTLGTIIALSGGGGGEGGDAGDTDAQVCHCLGAVGVGTLGDGGDDVRTRVQLWLLLSRCWCFRRKLLGLAVESWQRRVRATDNFRVTKHIRAYALDYTPRIAGPNHPER